MRLKRFLKFILVCFVLIVFGKSLAQSQTYKNQIGFKSDNDAYLAIKQDRYYTNGIEFFFIHAIKNSQNQDTTSQLLKTIWGVNAGQKIFNAYSGKTWFIENVDRPITGYLYASAYMQWLLKNETVYKAELQLGTIGPNALGKETQEFIHNTFKFYKPIGWQFQLNNAFGANLNLDYLKLLYRTKNKKSDFSLPLQLRLGSNFTSLNTAVLFRTGRFSALNNSTATQSNVANNSKANLDKYKEFYFYLRPSLSVVVYDATIQGGLFVANKGPVTHNPKPVVFVQEVGLNYAVNRFNLNLAFIIKSREIESTAKVHKYGSIGLGYRF